MQALQRKVDLIQNTLDLMSVDIDFITTGQESVQNAIDRIESRQLSLLPDLDD